MKKFMKKYSKVLIITIINFILLIAGFIFEQLIPTVIALSLVDIILFFIFKPKKKKFKFKEFMKILLIIGFTFGSLGILTALSFIIYIVAIAEPFDPSTLYNEVPSIIVDASGNELYKIGEQHRILVDYEEISQSLIDAVIATEDSRYYQHSGVDLPRFLVASLNQAIGNDAGGASTITMQVSKLTQTDTVSTGLAGIIRKFQDIYMSVFELETRYTKEEILEFYLNYVGMGGIVNGVGQASLTYFNKDASELNVAEAALLAGMLQSPEAYNPLNYPEAAEERRLEVLYLMHRHEYITDIEYEIAKELTVDKLLDTTNATTYNSDYQDYIDTVIAEAIDRGYNPSKTSMIIYTNIDTELQAYVDSVMDGETFNWKNEYLQAGAAFIEVDTGEIKAIAGGRDRTSGDWNFAVQNKRQIGSTAKPIYDYGPAIEFLNYNTYSPIVDEPHTYSGGINVNNFDLRYKGMMTFTDALKDSRNTTALKLFQENSNTKIYDFATSLGLSPEDSNGFLYEGHSLGAYNGESPLTVAAAYAAFSNGGYYIEAHSISEIEIIETGEVTKIIPEKEKVMSDATAYMITKVLEETGPSILGSINGVNYAAKSGTTDIEKEIVQAQGLNGNVGDKWIASYNDTYAVAMWMGFEQNIASEYNVYAFDQRNSLFRTLVDTIYTENSSWTKPSSVVTATVEVGLPEATLASEFTPDAMKETHYFKKGFEPTETSTRFAKLDDITNLNYNEDTNDLTWDSIKTPDFYDTTYLTNLFDPIFNSSTYLNNQVNATMDYNLSAMGAVTYDIYVDDELVGSTTESKYNYPISSSSTFTVKTTYASYKVNQSDGVSISVEKTANIITLELTTSSTITLEIGDTYSDAFKPVIVKQNGLVDVTSNANIVYMIKNNADDSFVPTFDDIDTSEEASYTVTYYITLDDYKGSISKIIKIEDSSLNP